MDNAGKFRFRTDQQLVTALLEDGYEGEELFDALAVVLPDLQPEAFNQYFDAWLDVQPWINRTKPRPDATRIRGIRR